MEEKEYYNEIKDLIINNEVNKRVKNYSINKSDLETKYNIGKLLSEAGRHYGEGVIKNYSIKLTKEFGKGYSERSLKYMRKYYVFQKGQPMVAELSWSHYTILLSIENVNKFNYYLYQVIKRNLSKRELEKIIRNKEYERLPEDAKNKLINNESLDISDSIPEPILIQNTFNKDKEHIKEKELQSIIVENITSFMEQLGRGYSFIKNEYKIKIDSNYNYIDILLYNIKFNCYVVVELKVTELKKEYFGQIQVYMNYIDKHLKSENQNKTKGILLVKENNNYVLYSSDGNIITRSFKLK